LSRDPFHCCVSLSSKRILPATVSVALQLLHSTLYLRQFQKISHWQPLSRTCYGHAQHDRRVCPSVRLSHTNIVSRAPFRCLYLKYTIHNAWCQLQRSRSTSSIQRVTPHLSVWHALILSLNSKLSNIGSYDFHFRVSQAL